MNKAETRAEHIDPTFAAAGRGGVGGSRIRREFPITLGRTNIRSGLKNHPYRSHYCYN